MSKANATEREPDNIYFDGSVVSYDIVRDGHKATLGIIESGFVGEFPTDDGGENITLYDDVDDAGLSITVVNANGDIEQSRVLAKKGDSISALGGTTLQIVTTTAPASYVCVYPSKPVTE